MSPSSNSISRAEIDSAVRNYWKIFTERDAQEHLQENCYAEAGTVFASSSRRLEPARLVLIRRQREYLAPGTKVEVQIGSMEVEILGPDAGIACYIMRLDAEQIATFTAAGQKVSEEHLEHARVTHVFRRYEDGGLRIVHEHISVPHQS